MKDKNGNKLTMCDYVNSRIAVRNGKFNVLHWGKNLFQHWIVDQYAKIEWDRLEYIWWHQDILKAGNYKGLISFMQNKSEQLGADVGKQIILPSSFYGSPRNMSMNFQ